MVLAESALKVAQQRQARRLSEAARGEGDPDLRRGLLAAGLRVGELAALTPARQYTALAEALSRMYAVDRRRLAMLVWDSEGIEIVRNLDD